MATVLGAQPASRVPEGGGYGHAGRDSIARAVLPQIEGGVALCDYVEIYGTTHRAPCLCLSVSVSVSACLSVCLSLSLLCKFTAMAPAPRPDARER